MPDPLVPFIGSYVGLLAYIGFQVASILVARLEAMPFAKNSVWGSLFIDPVFLISLPATIAILIAVAYNGGWRPALGWALIGFATTNTYSLLSKYIPACASKPVMIFGLVASVPLALVAFWFALT